MSTYAGHIDRHIAITVEPFCYDRFLSSYCVLLYAPWSIYARVLPSGADLPVASGPVLVTTNANVDADAVAVVIKVELLARRASGRGPVATRFRKGHR